MTMRCVALSLLRHTTSAPRSMAAGLGSNDDMPFCPTIVTIDMLADEGDVMPIMPDPLLSPLHPHAVTASTTPMEREKRTSLRLLRKGDADRASAPPGRTTSAATPGLQKP